MTTNDKGRTPVKDATPKDHERDLTSTERLTGWLTLAKHSRNRKPKREWQKGGRK